VSRDRGKGSFAALAGADPLVDYRAFYRARVVDQAPYPNLKVSVQPIEPKLPPLTNIPLRVGIPGASVELRLDQGDAVFVLVGWENGQPDRPFAALWLAGTAGARREQIKRVILEGLAVELGDANLVPVQDGVVTGRGTDPYTGLPYWMLGNSSAVVGAKK
jgi:hypothetical protein